MVILFDVDGEFKDSPISITYFSFKIISFYKLRFPSFNELLIFKENWVLRSGSYPETKFRLNLGAYSYRRTIDSQRETIINNILGEASYHSR